ncbi:aspartyl protease APCB1 [Cucurbita pepo subsp. pepo]|uniref:aspartyl protease APCB1 n=1 Tax=Cucurbita pepo subsp. pepo TaxID=3664 RepID=UPI000C9D8817|nr:aspartyl protease APCB1 [Cucurbita pepo subsp. pepo]XP_023519793.1 aspartyl protease APCB1 [Cucurbita pepo subsp. pepo]
MESDKIKGVVIITLPPPDNPSLGKSITAFTLTDDFSESPRESVAVGQEEREPNSNHLTLPPDLPIQTPSNQRSIPLSRELFAGTPRKLVVLLSIALVAIYLYSSSFPETLQELRSSEKNDDDRRTSLLFPLYFQSELGDSSDFQLKLGRTKGLNKDDLSAAFNDVLGVPKPTKLISSTLKSDSSAVFPVRGDIYPDGLYYTYIMVGEPPRPYFLDIDTGSDLTWVQCDAPCTSCGKGRSPLYKPKRENVVSFKDSLCMEVQRNYNGDQCATCHQCDYEIQYADQSSSLGVLVKDEFTLKFSNGSLTKLNAIFGCAYDQQGVLLNTLSKTDGILGLSRAKVSLPSQLASQGIINNVVGHCLTGDPASGGYMFLGDDFVPQWGMAWVAMLDSPSIDFYQTKVVRIDYGSSPLSFDTWGSNRGRVVFDSGSSYTYFTKEAYSQLVASLEELSAFGLIVQDSSDIICWRTESSIRSVKDVKRFFKPLTLQFESRFWIVSTKLEIPPENYLVINKEGNVCLGILDGSQVHDGSTTILGDNALRGKLVVYDNVNNRIGWTSSDCHNPRRMKRLPLF